MFQSSQISFIPFWAFLFVTGSDSFNTGEITEFHEPSYCAVDEYFDSNRLKCITCDTDKHLIPSNDGLSCVCNERSRIKKWNFASFPICEPCRDHEIPTKDQLDCIPCLFENVNKTASCEDFQCPVNTISVDRTPTGTLQKTLSCMKCDQGMQPSPSQDFCIPCKQTFSLGSKSKCFCQEGQTVIDDMCFNDSLKNWPDEKATYTIKYANGKEVDSLFLRENLLRGILLCKMGNQTSCQSVANMCSMVLYNDSQKSSPCSFFSDRKRIPVSVADHIPWIYYGEGEAPTVLSRKRISAQFDLYKNSPTSYLNFTGVIYNPDGRLKGVKKIFGHTLQLCPGSWIKMNSNFRFVAKYSHSCKIPAQQLINSHNTEFIDLFLRYKESNEEVLHAIPVLILNSKNLGVFGDNDRMQWQFVRRFFLLDKISGLDYDESESWLPEKIPKVVRYAESITLKVKIQEKEDGGKIYVPYLVIKYGEVTNEQIERNDLLFLNFRVDYQMDSSLSHVFEVCMGVFSGLAVVLSSIRTWSHSKRSGRLAIDFVTIAQLILFTCGILANVFFTIVFCISLGIFVFFKGQSVVHVLLPTESQEEIIKLYIIFAFLLKVVEICHLIYNQITIDIFFIDWERPRARNLIPRTTAKSTKNVEIDEEQTVSIWRTYFVANEWNEIQTKRKLNINIHLLITVFILKVVGLENWTTSDPDLYLSAQNSTGKEYNFTCRFAVGSFVYLSVYFIQRLFMSLIYERYVKNGIQEFVDMCSMANISVFILVLQNYGFYIHGRSAHGFADTDMQTIINQLQREEEDLVGHRGLLPGSDQQTFEMTVPSQLRAYYRKVMAPLKNMSQNIKRITISTISGRSKMESANLDRSVQAYHNMNRFLAAFLEHALKDLDFEVREKLFTESLLGIEFAEPSEKGIFYTDNGHSFDNVLFYGNELSLLTFDILLFSFVMALMEDYLLAGIVTAAFSHIIAMIRNVGGRKNLAKKTLIDERFLI